MKKNDAHFAYCSAGDLSEPAQPRDVDAYLESLIEAYRERLVAAPTTQERKDAWYLMKSLIECRSPRRVREMEVARGLA